MCVGCGADDNTIGMDGVVKEKKKKQLQSVRAVAIKKGVLVHEVDEGSPCTRCGDACAGFSLHYWRRICNNCLCPREEHVIREDEGVGMNIGKLLFAPTAEAKVSVEGMPSSPRFRRPLTEARRDNSSPNILRTLHNYLWVPKGCTTDVAQAYFKALPASKTPVRGTPGERYRQKQLIKQIPAHDVDPFYCNELSEEEKRQMTIFIRMRREKVLGKGEVRQREPGDKSSPWVCSGCKLPLKEGDIGVFAERAGRDKCWHPACFVCHDCRELLVDLIYFYQDGKLFCGRHHAEKVKPRCAACDELILCREYTHAEDQDWHLHHFCCLRCDEGLGGKQYRPSEGQPFCLTCYEIMFATVCNTCGDSISVDDARFQHKNNFWHATDKCFKCEVCRAPLVDKPFLPKYGKVFCSKQHCHKYREQAKKK